MSLIAGMFVLAVPLTDRQVRTGHPAWHALEPVFSMCSTIGGALEMLGNRHPIPVAAGLTVAMALLAGIAYRWSRKQSREMPRLTWVLAASATAGIWSQFLTFTNRPPGFTAWALLAAAFLMALVFGLLRSRSGNTPTQQIGRRRIILLGGILVIAALMRGYRIDNLPPGQAQHTAEWGMTGARLAHEEPFDPFTAAGRRVLFREMHLKLAVEPHQIGLNIFSDWILASLYKPSLIAQRTVSACFGILSVLAVFLAANAFLNPNAALIAAFLAAVSPWHIVHSRYSSPEHILAILFTTLSAWLAIRYFRRKTTGYLAALIVVCIIDFYLYVTAQFIIPVVMLMAVPAVAATGSKRRTLLIGLVVAGLLVSIGIAPKTGLYGMKTDLKWLNTQISEHPSYEVQGSERILRNTGVLLRGLFLNGGGEAWFTKTHGYLLWPVAVALMIGLGIAVTRILHLESAFLVTWFFMGILPTLPAPAVAPRRILCALPVVFILAAAGIDEFRCIFRRSAGSVGVMTTAAILMVCGGWQAFSMHSEVAEAVRNGPERRLAEIVCEYLPDHRVVILAESHTRLEKIMLHCGDLDFDVFGQRIVFANSEDALDEWVPEIERDISNGGRVLFIGYAGDQGTQMMRQVRTRFTGGSELVWRYDPHYEDHSAGDILFLGWVFEPGPNA